MASILALILAFVCTFISATGVTQSYSYDRRHLVKQIDQSYQNAALGPVTSVKRTYDGYGAIATEQTYVGGVLKDTWQQVHDSAGRRILLTEANNAATPFTYKYQADGNLVEADFNNAFYNYSYNSDGRLYWRGTPWHVQNITRDLSGRVTAAARTINGISVLDEKITWNGDSTQSGNAITRNGSWNENRSYGYDLRGHLLSENWMPSAAVSGTAIYQFDNNTLGGLGLRTNMTLGGGLSGSNAANYGSFARLGGFSTGGSLTGTQGTPVSQSFDATGQVVTRQTGAWTDTLTWDALGRLVSVSRRNGSNSGFNWSAVYDGLGRRLQTSQQTVTGGTPTGTALVIKSSYDPEVEFLEVAVTVGTQRNWLVHGPDLNGRYGSLQGTGGLEAVYNAATNTTMPVVLDSYGHAAATVTGSLLTWNPVKSSGYGTAAGSSAAQPLDTSRDFGTALAWRGRYIDGTGFYYMGARYYEPTSGTFLSADPLGHSASMSLYDYCNGDPVNGLDPDGRFGKGATSGWSGSIAANSPSSSAFYAGSMFGAGANGGLSGLAQGAKNDIAMVGVTGAAVFGGQASYVYVNGITDWAGWTDTESMTQAQQLQYNTTIYNATSSAQDVSFAVAGVYQAPKVTAPAPVQMPVPTIGGRSPINSTYAGQTHPSGVQFTNQGFPNFSPYAQAQVEIKGLTGNIKIDSKLANDAMCYPSTPQGYTWHHVEDGKTMQLVPQDIHQEVRHTGGAAVIRNGGFDQ